MNANYPSSVGLFPQLLWPGHRLALVWKIGLTIQSFFVAWWNMGWLNSCTSWKTIRPQTEPMVKALSLAPVSYYPCMSVHITVHARLIQGMLNHTFILQLFSDKHDSHLPFLQVQWTLVGQGYVLRTLFISIFYTFCGRLCLDLCLNRQIYG